MYSVETQSIRFPQFLRLSISSCVASYCVLSSVPLRIQRFRTSALVIASFFLSYISLSPRLVDLGYFAKPLGTRIKHLVDSLSLQLRTLPSPVSPYLFCLFLCCALHRLATPELIIWSPLPRGVPERKFRQQPDLQIVNPLLVRLL